MNSKSDEIDQLAELVRRNRYLYYQGQPEISDVDFDGIEARLRILSPSHPELNKVGDPSLTSEGTKAAHSIPMLSLAKTYEMSELKSWAKGRNLLAASKLDGVSLSLIYHKGQLELAKTRGNGKIGEIVTEKAKDVSACLVAIDHSRVCDIDIEVRGEVCCSSRQFVKLAEEMASLNLDRPSSPRNIVAGILSRKQHGELARFFDFFAFDLIAPELQDKISTESEKFSFLKELGFQVPDHKEVCDDEELENFIEQTKDAMNTGPIGVDGAVFTLNEISLHETLGSTTHHPRYKMSFKWPGKSAVSRIEALFWNTSRLGIVTPVAIIAPVELSDARISNVTLHNAATVKTHSLKPGDRIEVIRSGEVIPKFLRVVESIEGEYQFPDTCPACATLLEFDEVRLLCPNTKGCSAQQKGGILNWIRCAEIDDLSEKRLEALISRSYVKSASDLYRLTIEQFLSLPLTKEKMAEKLHNNIQNSRDIPLSQFLLGLGIKGVGRQSWDLLLDHFGSLERLKSAGIDEIVEIKGFAKTMAGQVLTGLAENESEMAELIDAGVRPFFQKKKLESKFSGKSFVITGSFESSRKEMVDLVEKLGAKVSSSVSSRTDFLVISDPASKSKKATDARKLSIPTWDEEIFWQELGPKPPSK